VGAVHLERVDGLVVACVAWLVLGGSLAALVAYNWLLRVTTPAVATTYAYVNPLVAVWLGWWLGGEQLTAAQVAWSAAIVGAVVLVSARQTPPSPAAPPDRVSS
jgi:drug/metabolite transporter (DMT)-like permease